MRLPPGMQKNVVLKPFTSYRIGGPATYYVQPSTLEELLGFLQWAQHESIAVCILAGGTNVLVADRGFPGLVIHLQGFLHHVFKLHSSGECVAGAGMALIPFVRRAAYRGFQGVEDLIGIPGTVGGALRMNAGAFSQEISQVLVDVEVLDEHFHLKMLTKDDIGFGYRQAPELENQIILKARFQLQPGGSLKLRARLHDILKMRRARQPLASPSCGSVFKRPVGDFAGRLIEAAGMKGVSIGGARVSPKHANFIINQGNACAADVLQLIKQIKRRVYDAFGVELQREVVLIGFDEEELVGA